MPISVEVGSNEASILANNLLLNLLLNYFVAKVTNEVKTSNKIKYKYLLDVCRCLAEVALLVM